ncbi:MAG: hypothetical protein K6F70_00650 [Eggerthellaceae bacterium]|nr:hypothetical protein [Eggerthellaceae bacterium]
MNPPSYIELMESALRRIEKAGWNDRLLGAAATSMLPAYRVLAPGGLHPSFCLETPLMGEPHCDLHVGLYKGELTEELVPDSWNEQCRAAIRFIQPYAHDSDFLFACDKHEGIPIGTVSGVYFKHKGYAYLAEGLLEAVGANDRYPGYLDAVLRLPEGWTSLYVGHFFDRPGSPVRLEATISPQEHDHAIRQPGLLRENLTAMGFEAMSDDMLDQAQALLELGIPSTVQFDVNPDGSLTDAFGLTVFYEDLGAHWRTAFAKDGSAQRTLDLVTELGIADERQELLERGSFSVRAPFVDDEGRAQEAVIQSWPACCKMKWRAGTLLPAKWYQRIEVGVREEG